MADFRLSTRAAADLGGIARHTIEAFGVEQARRYRDDLEACFQTLAANPRLGRSAERASTRPSTLRASLARRVLHAG
jgi:toxin ParE1/3/4